MCQHLYWPQKIVQIMDFHSIVLYYVNRTVVYYMVTVRPVTFYHRLKYNFQIYFSNKMSTRILLIIRWWMLCGFNINWHIRCLLLVSAFSFCVTRFFLFLFCGKKLLCRWTISNVYQNPLYDFYGANTFASLLSIFVHLYIIFI